jgi:predicted DNA-binding transcriptional regulator AlpA
MQSLIRNSTVDGQTTGTSLVMPQMWAELAPEEARLIPDTTVGIICGSSRAHIHRMRASGAFGPRAIKLGRKLLFDKNEVLAWISAGCPDVRMWAAMREAEARRSRRAI